MITKEDLGVYKKYSEKVLAIRSEIESAVGHVVAYLIVSDDKFERNTPDWGLTRMNELALYRAEIINNFDLYWHLSSDEIIGELIDDECKGIHRLDDWFSRDPEGIFEFRFPTEWILNIDLCKQECMSKMYDRAKILMEESEAQKRLRTEAEDLIQKEKRNAAITKAKKLFEEEFGDLSNITTWQEAIQAINKMNN